MHIKTNRIVFSGLFIACFLLSSNLTTNSASAASASITTNSSITLNTSSAGNGVSIDEESINITTTCTRGYDLTIATSTSANLYLNGDSTKTAAYTAVNGTSALDSTNNTNKWGYTLTNDATASTVFSPLSTTASSIRTISQTTGVTSETIPIYYGIKTGNTVNPGTYSMGNNGTITYYLTMNPLCSMVDIAYDGNNADAGTMGAAGTGVIHTGVKDGNTVNLIASNFSRNGYGFAGWSLDKDAGTKLLDNDNTNNPVVYGPQESITLPEGFADNDTDKDGIVKLYAVWLQSQGSLQGWVGCANLDTATYNSTTGALDLTKNSVTALTDMRDHDTYAVARLADGNCWMIENLRLEAEDTRGNNRFDSSITNESLAQGYGTSTTYGNFSGLADAESTGFSDTYSPNNLYSNDGSNGTINIGTSNPGARMPRYNNLNTPADASNRLQNPTSDTFTDNHTTVGMYSYGNYYTWHAAMANTTYYDSPTAQDADGKTSETVGTSLCPTGWRLPIGNQSTAANSFGALSVALGGPANGASANSSSTPTGAVMSARFRSFPNNFLYSGYFDTSWALSRGSNGNYWSSTVLDRYSSYTLYLNSSYVGPGISYDHKNFGDSIRCTVPSNLYAIHFDANTTDTVTGTMVNQAIAVDEAAQLNSNSFQRPATSSAGYRFVKWNTKPNGSGTDYADVASVTNLAAAGQTITLYAQWEQVTPMTVNFNGNGLSFADSSIANTVYYTNTCSTKYVSAPSYSHTSNINDDGTQIGTTKYNNNLATKDVITIPGATSLHATITYGTENNYDMLYVFQGEYTGSVTRNMSAGQLQKYMGGSNTTTTVELDIPGDTATFAFYSDHSGQYWGYHASVVGYYDAEPASYASTTQVCSRSLINGEYKTPNTGSLRTFYGWSEDQSATTVDYATADEVLNNLPGNNGETKTLYAILKNNLTINYNANGGTGTTASQTVAAGERITLKSNSFTAPTNTAFGGWNTEPDGTGTSYSANTTFTAPNSVTYNDSLTLYAQWLPQRQIIYNDNCSYNNAGCATNTDTTNTSSWTNAGSSITLGSDSYFNTRSGYAIASWNTARDGSGTSYNISSSYTVPSTLTTPDQVTLYAQWSPALKIIFNSNGGTGTMTSQLISENTSKALKSNSFTAPSGNYFAGWMTEESRVNNEVVYANGATYTAPTTVTPGDSITLYAKWGPRYTIVYNGNSPTGGSMVSSGTELKHTNINEGSTVNLYAPNYWKTGSGFVGWSPSSTATVGGTDPIYGPNESISAPSYDTYGEEINGTKTITLYAIWLAADSTKTMQTFTASDCQALPQTTFNSSTGKITTPAGSVIALKDQRDNNVYTVAKLADGKCWMTENLRLEAENTVGNNQSLSQGYGGVFAGLDTSENANFGGTTTATPNNLYNSSNITGSYPDYRFPRYNNNNTKTSLTASYNGTGSSTYYSWYSYGNYYSWAAAMANTTYYGSATGTSGSESAGTSICPTNWTLPTSGTTTKDFGTLSRSYDGSSGNQSSSVMSDRFRTFPNNFLYSGSFNGSSALNRGSSARYWSRSAIDIGFSYSLSLGSMSLSPSWDINKFNGLSVRCLVGS